jgi:Polyphenol oxidase middle domain/Protein of unknown function (DUF_B2219)
VFDSIWKDTRYTFFDEEAAQVEMTGCEILRAAQQLHYVYEGEPPQVNDFCLPILKFPPIIFQKEVIIRIPGPPIILGPEKISVPIDIKEARSRLAALAESKTTTVFLELDGVETDRQPGVAWQVYFALPPDKEPDEQSPYYIGALALFGQGVRAESHDKFESAHFAFAINKAVLAAVQLKQERWTITFVPRGILIDGKPSAPRVESQVKIAQASLTVETQKRGGEPK